MCCSRRTKSKATAQWSTAVHTVKSNTDHTYFLDNDHVYKFYELMPVGVVAGLPEHATRLKTSVATREQLKNQNTRLRRFAREGLEPVARTTTKRARNPYNATNLDRNGATVLWQALASW